MYVHVQKKSVQYADRDGSQVTLIVHHREMMYDDWFLFSQPKTRKNEQGLRYLIEKYIVRMTAGERGGEIDPMKFVDEQPLVMVAIIDDIHSESRHNSISSIESAENELRTDENNIHTIVDAFFFYHLDIGSYMALREADFDTRMRVLTHLERRARVNVLERFRTGMETGIVELIQPNEEYGRMQEQIRREMEHSMRGKRGPEPPVTQGHTDALDGILAEVKRVHEINMARDRANPSKSFDFTSDEAEIMRTEGNSDRQVLSTPRK